ncbi:hypothetical protein FLJC2902T_32180 [Flavobacterium limnosediminis JC2902]|uniref:Uncharacterized protein n=1 Tax=Flavobacterium limnosediminis JC2902 TaxID=1341181 RepID=V6SCG5_9FLAO|nr:hypothetical protein FLJC2902T_32180 [Flavobacterium limnosediminis JC2902]
MFSLRAKFALNLKHLPLTAVLKNGGVRDLSVMVSEYFSSPK